MMAKTHVMQGSAQVLGSRILCVRNRALSKAHAARHQAILQTARCATMSELASAPTKLQQLYDAGKAAFGGGRKAQPADLERLKKLMGAHSTLLPASCMRAQCASKVAEMSLVCVCGCPAGLPLSELGVQRLIDPLAVRAAPAWLPPWL